MSLLKIFTVLGIVFGFISALLWVKSATVTVKANGEPPHGGWGGGTVQDGNGNDVVKTLGEQSSWNAKAAICAALSALFQVLTLYINN